MTVTAGPSAVTPDADLTASAIRWNLEDLLDGFPSIDEALDAVDRLAEALVASGRGRIASMEPAELGAFYEAYGEMLDLQSRIGSYAGLRYAVDTEDPSNGALLARVEERSTRVGTDLLFIELEWAAVPDDHVDAILASAEPALDRVRHHLRSARRLRPHLLTEPEERIAAEKAGTGVSAWTRLFDELTSAIECPTDDGPVPLDRALSELSHPNRERRRAAQESVTAGLEPGLRTRAYVFNTLLQDRSVEDRLRGHSSWISARNLSNEASDESVDALIEAVVSRYDIPRRWYSLKSKLLGIERMADYDRMASVATSTSSIGWSEASRIVGDAYRSFSPELADIVDRFLSEPWIDAPAAPGKRGGAFCAYTAPSHHPYLMLNWTGTTRDVSTLAHELGHGVHAYLARDRGVFEMSTPLTLAETASVFGETVTTNRLLDLIDDPAERLTLLAETVDDSIATVFRQVAMNRFEDSVHTARRNEGELSVERFGDLWMASQADMVGDSVELTDRYRSWWSYIPHFMHTPGYVYAYAYGQLLALSVYQHFRSVGADFVPKYLDLLRAGGSLPPNRLAAIVDCDLDDPTFWEGGLSMIDAQLDAAEEAARTAGRI